MEAVSIERADGPVHVANCVGLAPHHDFDYRFGGKAGKVSHFDERHLFSVKHKGGRRVTDAAPKTSCIWAKRGGRGFTSRITRTYEEDCRGGGAGRRPFRNCLRVCQD